MFEYIHCNKYQDAWNLHTNIIWSKRSTDFKELSPCSVWYHLKTYSQTYIKRGHHIETKKLWPYNTGDLIKEVQFIFSIIGQENVTLYTADCFIEVTNRQTSGESASLPQYLGCNTVFDMRLRVTFLRRKTVSLQSNIAHSE